MKSSDVKKPGYRCSAVDQRLKRRIMLALSPAGQPRVQLDAAKTRNCSQSTVREALMDLQEGGLIVRPGSRGTVVSSVSAAEGQQSQDLRARIESRAAHFSITPFSASRIAALCQLARQMELVVALLFYGVY